MQNNDNDDSDNTTDTPPEWTSYSTPRDRVKAVAATVERPRAATHISTEAVVAKSDVEPILEDLVADGVLISKEGEDGVTRYRADPGWVREETLKALRRANSREDLEDMRDEMRDRLDDIADGAQYRLLEFRLGLIEDEIDDTHFDNSVDENN